MQTKRIQCPNCKVVLDVKNSHNEKIKQVNCPVCRSVLRVHFTSQEDHHDNEHKSDVPLEQSTLKIRRSFIVDGVQTKRIKCPICRVVLDVKNTANEDIKRICCPRCRSILDVKFTD